MVYKKFIGLQLIVNHLDWKNHIDQMIPVKHSTLCSMNLLCLFSSYNNTRDNLGGGGNSPNNQKILTLQKKIVRIMVGSKPRSLCKKFVILTLPCQYIFINKLHCKQPEKVSNKIICTQNEYKKYAPSSQTKSQSFNIFSKVYSMLTTKFQQFST